MEMFIHRWSVRFFKLLKTHKQRTPKYQRDLLSFGHVYHLHHQRTACASVSHPWPHSLLELCWWLWIIFVFRSASGKAVIWKDLSWRGVPPESTQPRGHNFRRRWTKRPWRKRIRVICRHHDCGKQTTGGWCGCGCGLCGSWSWCSENRRYRHRIVWCQRIGCDAACWVHRGPAGYWITLQFVVHVVGRVKHNYLFGFLPSLI